MNVKVSGKEDLIDSHRWPEKMKAGIEREGEEIIEREKREKRKSDRKSMRKK